MIRARAGRAERKRAEQAGQDGQSPSSGSVRSVPNMFGGHDPTSPREREPADISCHNPIQIMAEEDMAATTIQKHERARQSRKRHGFELRMPWHRRKAKAKFGEDEEDVTINPVIVLLSPQEQRKLHRQQIERVWKEMREAARLPPHPMSQSKPGFTQRISGIPHFI